MSKDKYIFFISDFHTPSRFSLDEIIGRCNKLHEYYESKEYKIALLQTDFNNILNGDELFPHNQNNALKYINKQEVKNSVKHYLDISKEFNIKTFSDISENKCILDSSGKPIKDINEIRIDVSEVNAKLLELLSKHPNYLYQLSSRKFEEVVAEIMIQMGYNVELTPSTHDGGKDIYVAHKNNLGSFLYLVECKKNAPDNHIGLDIIQRLYGVVSDEKATAGIIVTTSYFTKSAKDFQQKHSFQMSLKDFDSIKKWLYDIT